MSDLEEVDTEQIDWEATERLRVFFAKEVGEIAWKQSVDLQAATVEYIGEVLARFTKGSWIKNYIPITTQRPTTDAYTKDSAPPIPLATLCLESYGSFSRQQRLAKLQLIGEYTLRTAGFAADNLRRRPGALNYYRQVGQAVYGTIGRKYGVTNPAFSEISGKFVQVTDILNEMAKSNADIMELCAHYVETQSPRAARLLEKRGVHIMDLMLSDEQVYELKH